MSSEQDLFKEEGQTLSICIPREKVRAATAMMLLTEKSCLQNDSVINFSHKEIKVYLAKMLLLIYSNQIQIF